MNIPEGATHFKIIEGEIIFFKFLKVEYCGGRVEYYSRWLEAAGRWDRIPTDFHTQAGHKLPLDIKERSKNG